MAFRRRAWLRGGHGLGFLVLSNSLRNAWPVPMLPSLFPGPADPEHKALAHKAETMEKLSPTTFDAVPLKVRGSTTFEEARNLYSTVVDLQEEHPLVPVTINEVREHGGFGEQWTPPKAEVRALASLKFLKLIVTRNGTFVSTRAWAMGHSAEVSRAVMESSSSTTATSAAAAPTGSSSTSGTWADLKLKPAHPNPAKVLLVAASQWPGTTLLGDMLNRDPSALYLVEPCRSLEKLLKSHKGEYARLLGPNNDDQGATACVELLLRLVDCSFTEQDAKSLFSDSFVVSQSTQLQRLAHFPSERNRFQALLEYCRASPLRVVREDRVLAIAPFSNTEASLVSGIMTASNGLRVLHLVRDPRALAVARANNPQSQATSAGNNDNACAQVQKRGTAACFKWSCADVAQGLDAVDRLMGQVFGSSVKLQAVQGVRQFLRVRYEDLALKPFAELQRIYKWAMGNPPSAADLTSWALGNSRSGSFSSSGSGSRSSSSSSSRRHSHSSSHSSSSRSSGGSNQAPSHHLRANKRLDGRVNPRTPERAAARDEWKSATSSTASEGGGTSSGGVEVTRENVGSGGYRKVRQRRQLLEKKSWKGRPGIERPVVGNVVGGGEGWLQVQSEAHKQQAIEDAIKADAAAALAARKSQAAGSSTSDGSGYGSGYGSGSSSSSGGNKAQLYKAMGWSTQLTERQLQLANMECSASLRRLEYATEDELQQPAGDTNAASASLPAWAWATVPNRKIQMTVPY